MKRRLELIIEILRNWVITELFVSLHLLVEESFLAKKNVVSPGGKKKILVREKCFSFEYSCGNLQYM